VAPSLPKLILLVALVLALLTGAAFATSELLLNRQTATTTIPRHVDTIVIRSDAGDVQLVGARSDQVVLTQKRTWLFDAPKVHMTISHDTLELRAECPGARVPDRCTVDFALQVPFDVDTTVQGGAGDIHVDGVAGHVRIKTDAGNVSGQHLHAVSVDARTQAGDANFAFDTKPVSVRTSSNVGDITIEVPSGDYRVDTATKAGDVKVSGVLRNDHALRSIGAQTSAGNVTVRGLP
jgi:hypothetical protein